MSRIIGPLTDMVLGIGACGLLVGATTGILRTNTPVLFSLVSGIQWFGLGSVFYGMASSIWLGVLRSCEPYMC